MLDGTPPPTERTGNKQGGLAESPYNIYPTSDGYISIICINEKMWLELLRAMGRPDIIGDPRYSTKADRIARMDEVDEIVTRWSSALSTDQAFAALRSTGAICAPVRSLRDVLCDPNFRERGMVHDTDIPGVGELPLFHSPLLFRGEERLPLRVAPELGEHNNEVYGTWLGHSPAELAELRAEGVI